MDRDPYRKHTAVWQNSNFKLEGDEILRVAEIEVDDEAMKCTIRRKNGLYHRHKIPQHPPFTEEDLALMNELKRKVYAELKIQEGDLSNFKVDTTDF